MPTIVATAGASNANSFLTEVEQIAYMADRLNNSSWTTVTGSTCTDDEKKAMIEATREVDVREYSGARTDDDQALDWPRQWAANPDDPVQSYFDNTEVPTRIKNATAELAFQFIKEGTTDVAALDAAAGVKSKQVDVLKTEYFAASSTPTGLARYPRVMNYIRPLLAQPNLTLSVVRG